MFNGFAVLNRLMASLLVLGRHGLGCRRAWRLDEGRGTLMRHLRFTTFQEGLLTSRMVLATRLGALIGSPGLAN